MKYIDREDLVEGRVYFISSSTSKWIALWGKKGKMKALYLHSWKGAQYITHGSFGSKYLKFREATIDEENWLKACIHAGKFVDKYHGKTTKKEELYAIY